MDPTKYYLGRKDFNEPPPREPQVYVYNPSKAPYTAANGLRFPPHNYSVVSAETAEALKLQGAELTFEGDPGFVPLFKKYNL